MFIRRLDSASGFALNYCSGGHGCPALLEMECGDLAVIGLDITEMARKNLPSDCGCGGGERIVQIPRSVLVSAGQAMSGAH